MKEIRIKISFLFAFLILQQILFAQEERNKILENSSVKGYEYNIRAGFNLGGVTPIPIPVEIRSLNDYNPGLNLSIEGNVYKKCSGRWGMMAGLRLENKGMKSEADVKSYHMSMVRGGEKMEGYFTGTVSTETQSALLTLPILCTYNIGSRWRIKAGPYFSYLLKGDFTGSAFDGYLRNETPIGAKIEISDNSPATYDFSNDLRPFLFGAQLGGEWKAFTYFSIYVDFSCGLNSVFKTDFETITFGMYPLGANIGFVYTF